MLSRIRWIGAIFLLFYWSSLAWLPFAFRALDIDPKKWPLLVAFFEIYYAPFKAAMRLFIPILPHPEFMFYGPVLAILLPALISILCWWFALTHWKRTSGGSIA